MTHWRDTIRRYFFSSLRSRLLLLVLLGVIPALGLILYTGWQERRATTHLMNQEALRLARLVAVEEEQLIDRTRYFLMTIAELPQMHERNSKVINAFFARLLKQDSLYANLGLIDPQGNVIASAIPLHGPVNLGDRSYFRDALATRDFSVGSYQIGRITNRATLNFAYPILDDKGAPLAVAFASLDLAWLNQFMVRAQLPPQTIILAVEQTGTILARHPAPERWVGKRLPDDPLIRMMLTQREGTRELAGLDHVKRLYAYTGMNHPVSRGNVIVAVGIPVEYAYTAVRRTMTRNLLALTLAAVLAMLGAWFGGDLIVMRRMQDIIRATHRLEAGDLRARTRIPYGRGELSQLARAFDEMAAALDQRVAEREHAEHELVALNEDLEERVMQRTTELFEKNRQIEVELNMARDLQQAFLPQQDPILPHCDGPAGNNLHFYHRYQPSGMVGGDFYDMLTISETEAGVFICDVMGRGVRAALVTAIVRGLVEELKPVADDPGRFLTEVNKGLLAVFRQTGTPIFATAFYLVADVTTGRMRYANAGHPYPFHLHRGNGNGEGQVDTLISQDEGSNEPALGLIDGFTYPTRESQLATGDLVVLFTDGLFEVNGPSEEEYGPKRLLAAVRQRVHLAPLELFDELLSEIQQFSATSDFQDDVCLVGVEVTRAGVEEVKTRSAA